MPARAVEQTAVSVDFDELSLIQTALGHAETESGEPDLKRAAARLKKKLLRHEDAVYRKSPERTRIVLGPGEYETMMESLEFFVATGQAMPRHRSRAGALWARWLVEGGHVDTEGLKRLMERYDLE